MPKNLMWFNYFNYMHMGIVEELEHLKSSKVNGNIELVDYKEELRYAIATGSASAFSTELATKEEVERLLPMVEVVA